jgi:alkylated DNA repair dioxygenase AlkB
LLHSPHISGVSAVQLSLLEPAGIGPEGFRYRPELLSPAEERALLTRFGALEFQPYEFHGYLGKRRVVSFGLHYDFGAGGLRESIDIPDFLLPLRDRAAEFAAVEPASLTHALVTEYTPGAAIGWHRDRPVFGDVIGVSFGSACRFRFRRRSPPAASSPLAGEGTRGSVTAVGGWERMTVTLAPRSVYLLRGPARSEWEHSIPEAEELRYSVTFRSVKAR